MFDLFIKILIWISVSLFFVELGLGTENSHESHWIFLWVERTAALILTAEYLYRLAKDKKYLISPLGLIDLLAVAPFWLGFFVPASLLGIIRSLRILRLLKFFRYSRGLQLVALGFYRSFGKLKYLCFPVVVAIMFSTVAMFEAEHNAQPDAFSNLFDAFWFSMVTATTVGYGDISPSTVMGKVIAMGTFITVLSLFAGVIGVLGNELSQVLDEEIDVAIDPIEIFKESHKT